MIFIDTNSYLLFYKSHHDSLRNILTRLVEIEFDIFCPEQVVNEVNQNKLKLANVKLSAHRKKLTESLPRDSLAEHFENEGDKEWNQSFSELKKRLSEMIDNFDQMAVNLLTQISESEDIVSQKLEKLFSKPAIATKQQKVRATQRLTFGLPPGKKTDSVGDQLCWVQILDSIERDAGIPLWIVTEDGDYFQSVGPKNSKLLLNSLLFNELRNSKGGKPDVRIFKNITGALNDVEKFYGMESKFTKDEVQEMADSENEVRREEKTNADVRRLERYINSPTTKLMARAEKLMNSSTYRIMNSSKYKEW